MARTVYVVEAHLPYGGAYMAYHVARLLHLEFGFDARIATASPDAIAVEAHSPFPYDPVFPIVPLSQCIESIRDEDVLLCNPSFSGYGLGLTPRGRKIMYVQGFTTFSLLDCFFDHYVAVSGFVGRFLSQVYGLRASVIPAFVPDSPRILHPTGGRDPVDHWDARPARSIVLNVKGDIAQQVAVLARIRDGLRSRDRQLEESIDWDGAVARARARTGTREPRDRFLEEIAAARYLLTLSPTEGFGLVPLEAMGMGTVVMGFDGYGGREFMVSGVNCAVAAYPDVPAVVEGIVRSMHDLTFARRMAAAGVDTASRYTYETFRRAWVHELAGILGR